MIGLNRKIIRIMAGTYFETPTPFQIKAKQEGYRQEIEELTKNVNASNFVESQRRISILQRKVDALNPQPEPTVMNYHISLIPGVRI